MIVSRINGIRVGEIWFDEEPGDERVDIIRYYRRSESMAGVPYEESWTILVDLTKDPDSLLAGFKKDTRNEIRRAAARDAFVYQVWDHPNAENVESFCDFYDRFASFRMYPLVCRAFIKSLADANILTLSQVSAQDGSAVSWHAFQGTRQRVRALYLPSICKESFDSSYRSLLGRANRYHHSRDMLWFKEHGVSIYDFGTYHPGTTDPNMAGVNKFKEEFGGWAAKTYDFQVGVTLLGRLVLRARKFLWRGQPGVCLISIVATGRVDWKQRTCK
jgi:hypothetical protein